MKHAEMIQLPTLIRKILLEQSDETHLLSMPEIRAELENSGITADRRSVYKAISVLNENGEDIRYRTLDGKQGYWIRHPFTKAEALFLIDSIQSSFSLSAETSRAFSDRILSMLSTEQQKELPPTALAVSKTDSSNVLSLMETLLEAAAGRHPVEFHYYDLSVTRKKQYRRQNKTYRMVPYAIVSRGNRWYCVFYSENHGSFANYRIDKMELSKVLDEQCDPVRFSLADHIRSSFNMYHGEPQTVTVDFDLSLASIVFDEFGKDIIISNVSDSRFTASIRTAITPTLTSWLLQFYDRMEVRRPDELRDQMKKIAESLYQTYSKED